jgi:hypothetical protein
MKGITYNYGLYHKNILKTITNEEKKLPVRHAIFSFQTYRRCSYKAIPTLSVFSAGAPKMVVKLVKSQYWMLG